jgi:hypothetical protein
MDETLADPRILGHMPSLMAKVFHTKGRSKLQVSDIPLSRPSGGALGPESSSFYTFGSKLLATGSAGDIAQHPGTTPIYLSLPRIAGLL